MKIAILTDSFLPGVGGTEKAIFGLATEFSKNNEVIVGCPKYKKYEDSYDFKVIRAKSIKLTSNDEYWTVSCLSSDFKKQLIDFKPDIIHCHTPFSTAVMGVKIAEKLKIPVAITVHTKFKISFANAIKSKPIVNLMIKNIVKKLNRYDKVFTVSNDMARELKSYGYYESCTVIKNGSMFERAKNIPEIKKQAMEKYNIKESDNVLLFVGHIVKIKNLNMIFDALKILKERNIDYKMVFAGGGSDTAYYQKLTTKYALENNVVFTGVIRDKALLSSIYACGDLFLFPSIFDNDPLVTVEAALRETPALVLENTGASERIVNNVSGFIVENDLCKFTEKIEELLKNKDILVQAGKNAEKMIPKSWSETAAEYLSEYQLLIEQKKNELIGYSKKSGKRKKCLV